MNKKLLGIEKLDAFWHLAGLSLTVPKVAFRAAIYNNLCVLVKI